MTPAIIPYEAEASLDWIDLTDALAEGHTRPRAEIGDTLLYRGKDTLLNRAAWIDGLGLAVKSATIFPGNVSRSIPSINGGVALYSDLDGQMEALIDFQLVTKWKTAADSLLAARRLAPKSVNGILICGAGTVAASMVEAYRSAFPDVRIAIWNRTKANAERLAAATNTIVAGDLPNTARAADIICCATMSANPVLKGAWLRPGQHIDLIGAYRPDMREVDDDVLLRSRLFADSFATTIDHIGEFKNPLDRGVISRESIIADFYELEAFSREPDDITVCKNGGGAHLDLMTSRYILDKWRQTHP